MQKVYLDQNVFSTLVKAGETNREFKLLTKLVSEGRIIIPLTAAHFRETAAIGDSTLRTQIINMQVHLSKGWHLSISPEGNPVFKQQENPSEYLSQWLKRLSFETLEKFKAVKDGTRLNLAALGIASKSINNLSPKDLIIEINRILQMSEIETTIAQNDMIEAGIEANMSQIRDQYPGAAGEAHARSFEAQVRENLRNSPRPNVPKDAIGAAAYIAGAYPANILGPLLFHGGMFLLMSSVGYWTDKKPLEIEDVWHVQNGIFTDHFFSEDMHLLKRFETIKAIYELASPKLHNFGKYVKRR